MCKGRKYRVLSWVLTVVMLFGMVVTPVSATSTADTDAAIVELADETGNLTGSSEDANQTEEAAAQTGEDESQTEEAEVQTGEDESQTEVEAVQTEEDASQAEEDEAQTGDNANLTEEDANQNEDASSQL